MIKIKWAIITFLLCTSVAIFGQTNKKVPFIIAKNYFVNNTYQISDIPSHKILSKEDFGKFIGMATVMGPNGKPTEINFSKQFVVVAIEDITDVNTILTPEKLTVSGKMKLKFRYKIYKGEKMTSTMRPFSMIIVDKKYKNYTIELESYSGKK